MPEKFDELEVSVDMTTGLIKITTEKISAANHASAGEFLKFLSRLCGGETTSTPRHKHTHSHSHEVAKEKA